MLEHVDQSLARVWLNHWLSLVNVWLKKKTVTRMI